MLKHVSDKNFIFPKRRRSLAGKGHFKNSRRSKNLIILAISRLPICNTQIKLNSNKSED